MGAPGPNTGRSRLTICPCRNCQAIIEKPHKGQIYCSDTCERAYIAAHGAPLTCEYCGGFYAKHLKSGSRKDEERRFCSNVCYRASQSAWKRDPSAWPATRTCNRCGAEKPLEEFDKMASGLYYRTAICKACRRAASHAWYVAHSEHLRAYEKRHAQANKQEAMDAYGACCACCGEDALVFLQLDHTNGDGKQHRAAVGKRGWGNQMYEWLKKHSYPPGFTVLCANCHAAKTCRVVCPHKTRAQC